MEELIKDLNMNLNYTTKDGVIIADLASSDEFSKVYFKLSNLDSLDIDQDNFNINTDTADIVFLADNYDVYLTADFNANKYQLKIAEAKD